MGSLFRLSALCFLFLLCLLSLTFCPLISAGLSGPVVSSSLYGSFTAGRSLRTLTPFSSPLNTCFKPYDPDVSIPARKESTSDFVFCFLAFLTGPFCVQYHMLLIICLIQRQYFFLLTLPAERRAVVRLAARRGLSDGQEFFLPRDGELSDEQFFLPRDVQCFLPRDGG